MYENFLQYMEAHPGEKVFGQFGKCHITTDEENTTCNFESFRSFAQRIKESKEDYLKDKVFSIPIIYYHALRSSFGDRTDAQHVKVALGLKDQTGLYLVKIENDTNFSHLSEDFKYAFINYDKVKSNLSYDYTYKSSFGTSKHDYFGYAHGEFNMTYHGFEWNELNSALKALNIAEFSPMVKGYGIGFTVYEPVFFYGGGYFDWWKAEEVSNDSLSLSLQGASFILRVGFPILDHKHFQIAPFGGIGVGSMKLTEARKQVGSVATPSVLLQAVEADESVYRNPAILSEIGADLKVKFFPWALSVKGGYQLDVSDKHWKTQDGGATIETSYSSWFASVGASLYFGYN